MENQNKTILLFEKKTENFSGDAIHEFLERSQPRAIAKEALLKREDGRFIWMFPKIGGYPPKSSMD